MMPEIYNKWVKKIGEAQIEYRRENLLSAGQLTTTDWNQIYKNAGMSDKEIQEYRKAMEPYQAALQDSSDPYRD